MKKHTLFFTMLFTICILVISCGEDESLITKPTVTPNEEESPSEGENSNEENQEPTPEGVYTAFMNNDSITLKNVFQLGNDSVAFVGITLEGNLIFKIYQGDIAYLKEISNKIFELKDKIKLDTIYSLYKGYGEYEKVKVNRIDFEHFNVKHNNEIISLLCLNTNTNNNLYRALFVNDKKNTLTGVYKNISYNGITYIPNWFNNETYFIHDCCYTLAGDTLYTIPETDLEEYRGGLIGGSLGFNDNLIFEQISSELAIGVCSNSYNFCNELKFAKINYKDNSQEWLSTSSVPIAFSVDNQYKEKITLTEKSSNIWTYKIEYLFYDGTIKKYKVKVDINNGQIIYGEEYAKLCSECIIGEWYLQNYNIEIIALFNSDGTFEYNFRDHKSLLTLYKKYGIYKIENNKLYEKYNGEDEWVASVILKLNRFDFLIDNWNADPDGNKTSYLWR